MARSGRSLSLKDTDIPAALLVGDYLIAPLYDWAERLRSDAIPQTLIQSPSSKNDENGDDASTGTSMPGTPCLNSACGEEFDPNGGRKGFLVW